MLLFAVGTAFFMRTKRSADEVLALYRAGPKDRFESSTLELIDATELLGDDNTAFMYEWMEGSNYHHMQASGSLLTLYATVYTTTVQGAAHTVCERQSPALEGVRGTTGTGCGDHCSHVKNQLRQRP